MCFCRRDRGRLPGVEEIAQLACAAVLAARGRARPYLLARKCHADCPPQVRKREASGGQTTESQSVPAAVCARRSSRTPRCRRAESAAPFNGIRLAHADQPVAERDAWIAHVL